MATGYDRFVRKAANGAFYFTDATGACRGVILTATDCGTSGFAVKSLGHKLVGEVFPYYVDADNKMRAVSADIVAHKRQRFPNLFEVASRNVLDYIPRCNAY